MGGPFAVAEGRTALKVLLSVVVPTTRDVIALPQALASLMASDLPREFWELVVVDDGSTDHTVGIAAPVADCIVRIPGRSHGPAYARNRGAEAARGEILVFIDADVCVVPDTLRRFAWAFLESPGLAAVSGAYADGAESRGVVSRYRDLTNHYLQTEARALNSGFWADCGAVRRGVFLAVGMFNEWYFDRPQIEAIELGQRLKDRGARVECRQEIQATHLKRWTLPGMIAADLKDRGVPQSRLASISSRPDHRIARVREHLCAAMAWLAVAGLIAGGLGFRSGFVWSAGLLAGILWLDRLIIRLFHRRYGLGFSVAAASLQWLHYLVGGVASLLGMLLRHSIGDPQPSASVQAFSEVGVAKWPPVPKSSPSWRDPGSEGPTSGSTL